MADISLTRGQFLVQFIDMLADTGVATESMLIKHALPGNLEHAVDTYVPMVNAIQFTDTASRSQGIPDFGHFVSLGASISWLSRQLRALIFNSPTLLCALRNLCLYAHIESTALSYSLASHGSSIRLCGKYNGITGLRGMEHAEWILNAVPIQIVRQFTGPAWVPEAMGFQARYAPSPQALEHWPNTRIITGQQTSWIEIPANCMSLPGTSGLQSHTAVVADIADSDGRLVKSLKLMLPSYLGGRIPSLEELAEMANTSTRSLQRLLREAGTSYRDILNVARFERAAMLLEKSDMIITDIGRALGYTDGAHFTRAFRRISGMTPMEYRKNRNFATLTVQS